MGLLAEILGAVLILVGSAVVLLTTIAMVRAGDAVTRINALSPVTALALPLVVLGAYLHTVVASGFTVWGLVRLVITLVALVVVSSLASNALARAAVLSGAKISADTAPNDLAEDPTDDTR